MSLKNIMQARNKVQHTYVTGVLDMYLMEKAAKEENDRAINVNAPSQVGNCMRSNFYMRTQCEQDGVPDARVERIFDNGTGVHERLQKYLLDIGILICDECPLLNEEYNIQGHTDGILDLKDEIAILEIKSINDYGFSKLKDTKPEHKQQGLVYLYCLEERRKYLHMKYKDRKDFFADYEHLGKEAAKHYSHLKDGSKYSRDEKIANQVKLHNIVDDILIDTYSPVTKVIFLYENKNTQEIKEFVLDSNSSEAMDMLSDILLRFSELNHYVQDNKVPPREGNSRSCDTCRWCNYKTECWR